MQNADAHPHAPCTRTPPDGGAGPTRRGPDRFVGQGGGWSRQAGVCDGHAHCARCQYLWQAHRLRKGHPATHRKVSAAHQAAILGFIASMTCPPTHPNPSIARGPNDLANAKPQPIRMLRFEVMDADQSGRLTREDLGFMVRETTKAYSREQAMAAVEEEEDKFFSGFARMMGRATEVLNDVDFGGVGQMSGAGAAMCTSVMPAHAPMAQPEMQASDSVRMIVTPDPEDVSSSKRNTGSDEEEEVEATPTEKERRGS
eukprot:1531981-Prymnesium_polylepis.1